MAEVTEYYDRRDNSNNEDEISLLDLYLVLARRKWTIIGTVVLVVMLCTAYLLIATKVYKTSVVLLPPLENEIFLTDMDGVSLTLSKGYRDKGIKSSSLSIVPLNTPKNVFDALKSELRSKTNWNLFIKEHSHLIPQTPADTANERKLVNNPLHTEEDKDFPWEHSVIIYESSDKEKIGGVLKQYLMFVEQRYIEELKDQTTQKVNFHIAALQTDIQQSRENAKIEVEDEINRLENSLTIAKKLGIKDNQLVTIKNPQSLTVVTSDLKTPDYMRGTKVLSAELEQLRKRTSNDPYIPGLRDKQSALQRLQSMKFTPETFKPLRLDGGISAPQRVKPKTTLVLALGVVLGLMMGVFTAFFMEFLKKVHTQQT